MSKKQDDRDTRSVPVIAVDLDDVLCIRPKEFEHLGVKKYEHCVPIQKNIDIINDAYDNGFEIIIYTARGMSQFNRDIFEVIRELYVLTENQLKKWKIKYHELSMGKIHYDLLIDDKAINSSDDFKSKILELMESGNS